MKTIQLLCIVLTSITLQAQSNALDAFYKQHKSEENGLQLQLGNTLLMLGSWLIEEPAAKKLIQKSNKARIIFSDQDNTINQRAINRLINKIGREGYESLATVRSGTDHLNFYIREDHEYIRNLLVVVQDEDDFILASLDCRIKLADVETVLTEL